MHIFGSFCRKYFKACSRTKKHTMFSTPCEDNLGTRYVMVQNVPHHQLNQYLQKVLTFLLVIFLILIY